MWRIGIGLGAAALLLGNGFLHGLCTNRWHRSAALETAISKVERVPMTIGYWQARSDAIDDAARTQAGIDGYFLRHYENKLTGKTVTVLLMCGRPGPISLHTPDICYRGAGYQMEGAIAKWAVKYGNASASADFDRAKFSKADATGSTSLRIEWCWGTEQKWLAPPTPRFTFARLPVLYKLYVIQQVTPLSEKSDEEVCRDFLGQLLPVLDNALYSTK
jgi:hypothetical protein